MKILFDYQAFEMQKFGGISRIYAEILRFLKRDAISWDLPIKYSSNQYLMDIQELKDRIMEKPDPYKNFITEKDFRGKRRLFHLRNKFSPPENLNDFNKKLSIEHISTGNYDLFHPTYYDDYFLNHLVKKPYVITVYDMIHEIYPEYLFNDPILFFKRKVVEKASAVIAISENTKKDLINIYKVPEEKVEVVYPGSGLLAANEESLRSINNLPEKYILYVGNRRIYKNFYFFLNSIVPLLEKDPTLHIVCTGMEFDQIEISFFQNLKVAERLHHYFVNDTDLYWFYKKAIAFVFPSLYEGFGIPVLEAFTTGCPAILSNTSSLPEVGGDAAIYFDPKNAVSIRQGVHKVLNDPGLREEMIAKGRERAKLFSWEKMYNQTMEVYRKVLSQ